MFCFIKIFYFIKNVGTDMLQRQNYKTAALKIIASATDATSCHQMSLALPKKKKKYF